jgi:hypothetical protein
MSDDKPLKNGAVLGILDRLLVFVDKPWKAVVVILLIVIGGLGWVLYEKRNELFEAWLTPDTPELKTADIPEALAKLTQETNADLVQIWAVNLASNSQWFMGARRHDGERPVIPSPRRLPIIDRTSDVRMLVDILDGQPTCVDVVVTGTPIARRLAARGMKRGCAIPIPPNRDAFVGAIYLAWINPPDGQSEAVAVGAAREIARKLSTH